MLYHRGRNYSSTPNSLAIPPTPHTFHVFHMLDGDDAMTEHFMNFIVSRMNEKTQEMYREAYAHYAKPARPQMPR